MPFERPNIKSEGIVPPAELSDKGGLSQEDLDIRTDIPQSEGLNSHSGFQENQIDGGLVQPAVRARDEQPISVKSGTIDESEILKFKVANVRE